MIIFMDGFDKYGPPGIMSPNPLTLLQAGEWTTSNASVAIAPGLSGVGYALTISHSLNKTLSGNYPTLIAGMRFSTALQSNGTCSMQFFDGTTIQAMVFIDSGTGRLYITYGGPYNTVASTAGPVVSAGVTHHLEVQLTFSNPGNYAAYIDGVLVLSGSGTLKVTSNSTANGFAVTGEVNATTTLDDLYLFDNTGTANNAPLQTQPIVETTYPTSDAQTQFTNSASLIGDIRAGSGYGVCYANDMDLMGPYQSGTAVSLNSVSAWPQATSSTANIRAVIYHDHSGTPVGGALVASSNQVTGCTAGVELRCNFASPVSIAANTPYWIGFMSDTTINLAKLPGPSATAYLGYAPYASGAPSTAPALATDIPFVCWGACTGSAKNWVSENISGPPGDYSYINSSVVGNEDLYGLGPLLVVPSVIYATSGKVYAKRSDNGSRTVDIRLKSGSVDSPGNNTNMVPGTSYTWLSSYWEKDPNGSITWTKANLDAAQTGPQVAS